MSSLNSALQLALPNWVRARGLAYYLVVFQGAQAAGAVLWGTVADWSTVTTAMLTAAAVLALGAVIGLRSPVPDTASLDRTPSAHWPAPQLTFTPDATDGPVLVTLTYRVPDENAAAFTEAMRHVGRSRRRTGALRWELFRDGIDPTRFVETYLVGHLGRAPSAAREPADRGGPPLRGAGAASCRGRAAGRPPLPATGGTDDAIAGSRARARRGRTVPTRGWTSSPSRSTCRAGRSGSCDPDLRRSWPARRTARRGSCTRRTGLSRGPAPTRRPEVRLHRLAGPR